MNKKEKQYQAALDQAFHKATGYLKKNMNPDDISARITTAVNIAIGDDGFRAKEIVENFEQLMEMDETRYAKQRKFYG